ncbi:MAG: lysophospholipid acyltransferase family protein, partial [Candidatus Rokuibacteriota bacterium]
KLAGAPIVPLGLGASRRTVLRSWDRFLIPHPFARVVVVFGEPLRVPADADRDAVERHRRALEAALVDVTREADRVAGAPDVLPL